MKPQRSSAILGVSPDSILDIGPTGSGSAPETEGSDMSPPDSASLLCVSMFPTASIAALLSRSAWDLVSLSVFRLCVALRRLYLLGALLSAATPDGPSCPFLYSSSQLHTS